VAFGGLALLGFARGFEHPLAGLQLFRRQFRLDDDEDEGAGAGAGRGGASATGRGFISNPVGAATGGAGDRRAIHAPTLGLTTTVLDRPWLKLCFTVPALTAPLRGFKVSGVRPPAGSHCRSRRSFARFNSLSAQKRRGSHGSICQSERNVTVPPAAEPDRLEPERFGVNQAP